MIYAYDAKNGKWHGFLGEYYNDSAFNRAANWCKQTGNLIQIRDQQYIDYLFMNVVQPEKYIEVHQSDEV